VKVYKVADIINNEVVLCVNGPRAGDVTALLTSMESVANPKPNSAWKLEITISDGSRTVNHLLDLRSQISETDSLQEPLFLAKEQLIFFRDRLFMPDRVPKSDAEREEIVLRTKKLVYDEAADLASLKAAVANLEAAIEYTRIGPRRDPIPEDVKLVVWTRDGGACVGCGSRTELHFDHIIPVAKGGGNGQENIQVLCQPCNLKKADKIAT
jgi:hypothetical protein